MQNNPFISWLIESWKRLSLKSPKFFKVLKIIMGIPAFLVTLPNLIETMVKPFFPNLDLTPLQGTLNAVVAWSAAIGFWISLLPVAEVEKPQVKEKLPFTKTVGVILILISFSLCGFSQSNFVKPIPKMPRISQRINNITGVLTNVVVAEPTFWMLRPAAIAGTLYVGGTVEAAAGVGIAYQNITQKGVEQRNYVNYDIGIYSLLGGSVVSSDSIRSDIEKFVLAASALNGTIALGYGLSRQEVDPITQKRKWKGGLFLAWKINFNN